MAQEVSWGVYEQPVTWQTPFVSQPLTEMFVASAICNRD
jgi:hypothetical protein